MAVGTNYRNTGRSPENCRRYPDGVRCPFCGSFDTKFKFLNNKKADQPRYQCSICNRFWTEGGRIRGTYTRTEEVRNPVAADTPSQPSGSAVSTPTPTASNGRLAGLEEFPIHLFRVFCGKLQNGIEKDFPDLD